MCTVDWFFLRVYAHFSLEAFLQLSTISISNFMVIWKTDKYIRHDNKWAFCCLPLKLLAPSKNIIKRNALKHADTHAHIYAHGLPARDQNKAERTYIFQAQKCKWTRKMTKIQNLLPHIWYTKWYSIVSLVWLGSKQFQCTHRDPKKKPQTRNLLLSMTIFSSNQMEIHCIQKATCIMRTS